LGASVKPAWFEVKKFFPVFCFLVLVAAGANAASRDCALDEVCLFAGVDFGGASRADSSSAASGGAGVGGAVETAFGGAPVSLRDVSSLAKQMPSFYDSALRSSGWCQKFLENDKGKNSVSTYESRVGLPQRSWEQILLDVSKNTGVKPEYLCVLLYLESRGNVRDVGGDGECGAFQTMPQFYANYESYCSKWSGEYDFVKATCKREKWGNLQYNAYPSADLPESLNDEKSCFHPFNSAMAGAIEFKGKLNAKRCSGDVHCAFWGYNGYSEKGRKYADRAMVKLQQVYDSTVG
jgi:hypothetical protein